VAEDVTALDPAGLPAADTRSRGARRRERARGNAYRLRFGLVYLALAVVLGAGVGAFVVLATRAEPEPEPPWSAWQPTGSPEAKLKQIADRIPQAYRVGGEQLAVSTVSPLTVNDEQGEVPIETIFLLPDTSRGLAEEDDIDRFDGNSAVSFGLCGVGDNGCALPGKETAARRTLVHRQALELALYTFKYVAEIESVLVFLPGPDGQPSGTVFLTRDDVAPELRRPLAELLPTRSPTVGGLTEVEEGHVLRLVEPRTYAFEIDQAPDGSLLLALSPPTASGQTP
jgi:hypothetical protein